MNKSVFSIEIKTKKESVWKALWDDQAYRDWASVFFEGSYMVYDKLNEGNTVHFLGPDKSGIYSVIENHIPNEKIQFKHIGSVVEGEEQAIDEESKKWSGATEAYSIIEDGDTCTLLVEIDIMEEHLEFMTTTFPLALKKVKENCR